MPALSYPQRKLLEAMSPGRWYEDTELPPFRGQTYRSLVDKGLLVARRVKPVGLTRYVPYKWLHVFMRPDVRKVQVSDER